MKKQKVISALPVIIIMAVIFFFSAQTGDESSKLSSRISDEVGKTGFFENAVYVVRKSAHFIIYTMLGFSVRFHMNFYKLSGKAKFLISLAVCFLYASSDEIHQLFVSGRSGQFSDVMLDTSGSLFGIIILTVLFFIFGRKNKPQMH